MMVDHVWFNYLFAIINLQFYHSEAITVNLSFHNGKSVLEKYVDVYVFIIPKLIDNCNVKRRNFIDLFVIFIQKLDDDFWVY